MPGELAYSNTITAILCNRFVFKLLYIHCCLRDPSLVTRYYANDCYPRVENPAAVNRDSSNDCFPEVLSALHLKMENLSAIYAVPITEIAPMLQCTWNEGQVDNFLWKHCSDRTPLIIHIGSPYYHQRWHVKVFADYFDKVKSAVKGLISIDQLWTDL